MPAAPLNLVTAATAARIRDLLAEGASLRSGRADWSPAASDPPPRPLELRLLPRPDGLPGAVIAVWLGPSGSEAAGAVRVNGAAVSGLYQGATLTPYVRAPVPAGWYVDSGLPDPAPGVAVWIVWRQTATGDGAAPAAQTGGLAWALSSSPAASDWPGLYAHPVLLGIVAADGGIAQAACGAVDVSVWLPDDQAALGAAYPEDPWQSLDQLVDGIAQLHDFRDAVPLPPGDIETGLTSAPQAQVVLRVPRAAGGARIAYANVADLVAALADGGLVPDTDELRTLDDLESYPCPADHTGALVLWDPCLPGWVDLSRLPANDPRLARLPYWPRGGGATACYGSGIGDSSKQQVVDLDGRELVGTWGVTGDLNASYGLVQAGTLEVMAASVTVNGDVYVPTQITVGSTAYTVLAKP